MRGLPYSAEYVREHIQARIVIEDRGYKTPCWIWQSGLNGDGYATGRPAGCKKTAVMHRRSYEASIGPIPDGLVLDHLCRVPACVNPSHLEPVTQHENMRRSPSWGVTLAAGRKPGTHCYRGHELTSENVIISKNKRRCRICNLAWRDAKKLAAGSNLYRADGGGSRASKPTAGTHTERHGLALHNSALL